MPRPVIRCAAILATAASPNRQQAKKKMRGRRVSLPVPHLVANIWVSLIVQITLDLYVLRGRGRQWSLSSERLSQGRVSTTSFVAEFLCCVSVCLCARFSFSFRSSSTVC